MFMAAAAIKVFERVFESEKAFFWGFVSEWKLPIICRFSGFPD
jgi:hypothetical protein